MTNQISGLARRRKTKRRLPAGHVTGGRNLAIGLKLRQVIEKHKAEQPDDEEIWHA